MKKGLKIIYILLIIFLAVLLSGAVYAYVQFLPMQRGEHKEAVRVEIPSGMSVLDAGVMLSAYGLIRNQNAFYYTARYPLLKKIIYGKGSAEPFILRSGIYYIKPSMNLAEIQQVLSSGQQEYVRVAIPEGLTITKIASILDENKICKADEFIKTAKDALVASDLGIPAESCEGFLFPDTYFLTFGMSARSVVKLMVENFFEKIQQIPELEKKSEGDLLQTVILASIVEREYRVREEAPLIASVFKNRLKSNIGLYSCATIEYILTEIEGRPHPDRILIEDTKIDSPYNTYVWAGLPPGPISNPGLVALEAATNTPKTDYYFFQIVDSDQGRHVFSTSFEEHKVNHNLSLKK